MLQDIPREYQNDPNIVTFISTHTLDIGIIESSIMIYNLGFYILVFGTWFELASISIRRVPLGECITLDVGGHKNGKGFVGIIIPKSEINLFSRTSLYFSGHSKFVYASNYMSSWDRFWHFRFKE
jgi:hypothetical protein